MQPWAGLNWVNLTPAQWVAHLRDCLQVPGGGRIVTPNPEILMAAQTDEALAHSLRSADFCLPDGVGIVWASRISGNPIAQRLAGSDTLEALLPIYAGSLFLWGGAPGVADEAARCVGRQYPQISVCGTASGYYEASEETDIIESVQRLQPRLVLLGLGSPKQEQLMQRVYAAYPDAWYMGVGGMIDVLAGRVSRAPLVWRRLGLEWVYRALREPRRLKRWPALGHFVFWVLRNQWRR